MNEARRIEELAELAEAVARARVRYGRRGSLSFVIWGSYVLLSSLLSGLLGWWLAWPALVFLAGFVDAGRLAGRWARAALAFGLGFLLTFGVALLVHPAPAMVLLGLSVGLGYSLSVDKAEGASPVFRLVGGLWFFLVLAAVTIIASLRLWASSHQLVVWASVIGAGMGVLGFGSRSWSYGIGAILILAMVIAWSFLWVPPWVFGVGFGLVLTAAGAYEYWRLSRA